MRVTIRDLQAMKDKGQRIPVVTAYDYATAKILNKAGIPMILVGDSLGMTVLGYDSTIPVTMDDMLHHIGAVTRGTDRALVVGDLPFMTYQVNPDQALTNAGRFMQGGCQAVKLEGGVAVADTVRRLVEAGIPVMGHIGLTPQAVNQLGGFRAQGKTLKAAVRLLQDAQALQDAGAFSIVLECVPSELARLITERLSIFTIGIGSGSDCGGQVQVFHDILGLNLDFTPRHAKIYAGLGESILEAVQSYMQEVGDAIFPLEENGTRLEAAILDELLREA